MKWKVPQKKSKMERMCRAAPVLNQVPHEAVRVQLHSFLKWRKSLVTFMHRHLYPRAKSPATHYTGDRVSLRASLDVSEIENHFLSRESNSD